MGHFTRLRRCVPAPDVAYMGIRLLMQMFKMSRRLHLPLALISTNIDGPLGNSMVAFSLKLATLLYCDLLEMHNSYL